MYTWRECLMLNFIRYERIKDKTLKTLIENREENDKPDDLIQHHIIYGLMTARSDHHSQYAYSRGRKIRSRILFDDSCHI